MRYAARESELKYQNVSLLDIDGGMGMQTNEDVPRSQKLTRCNQNKMPMPLDIDDESLPNIDGGMGMQTNQDVLRKQKLTRYNQSKMAMPLEYR